MKTDELKELSKTLEKKRKKKVKKVILEVLEKENKKSEIGGRVNVPFTKLCKKVAIKLCELTRSEMKDILNEMESEREDIVSDSHEELVEYWSKKVDE